MGVFGYSIHKIGVSKDWTNPSAAPHRQPAGIRNMGQSRQSRLRHPRLRSGFRSPPETRTRGRALRQHLHETAQAVLEARRAGDVDNDPLGSGQDAGLIDSIKSAEEVVRGMVAEAEEIIGGRFQGLPHSGQ